MVILKFFFIEDIFMLPTLINHIGALPFATAKRSLVCDDSGLAILSKDQIQRLLHFGALQPGSLYPQTPALAKAGAAPGTIEGVEPELSKSLLFWARKQTRQKFALAMGSAPDCGQSCADYRLGALARQILFF